MQFISFLVSTIEKCFRQILTTFLGLGTIGQAKLKIGPGRLGFALETYRQSFGCNSYHFLLVRSKNVSVSFDDFSGPGTTGVGKVENKAQMTRFSARNITTLFGVQFLSFRISTTKPCFGRILTTFPGSSPTGAGKVENRARMTQFCTRNIPT